MQTIVAAVPAGASGRDIVGGELSSNANNMATTEANEGGGAQANANGLLDKEEAKAMMVSIGYKVADARHSPTKVALPSEFLAAENAARATDTSAADSGPLKPFETSHGGYFCDKCSQRVAAGVMMHGLPGNPGTYDLCGTCFNAAPDRLRACPSADGSTDGSSVGSNGKEVSGDVPRPTEAEELSRADTSAANAEEVHVVAVVSLEASGDRAHTLAAKVASTSADHALALAESQSDPWTRMATLVTTVVPRMVEQHDQRIEQLKAKHVSSMSEALSSAAAEHTEALNAAKAEHAAAVAMASVEEQEKAQQLVVATHAALRKEHLEAAADVESKTAAQLQDLQSALESAKTEHATSTIT